MAAQPEAQPTSGSEGGIAGYFKFAERGTNILTESRAGLTTFMVMAYIIFLNGNIIAKPLKPRPGRSRRPGPPSSPGS